MLLLANAAISFASTLLSVLELLWPGDLFAEGFENNPVTLVLWLLTLALAVVQIVVFFATVVVFLMWLYRALIIALRSQYLLQILQTRPVSM